MAQPLSNDETIAKLNEVAKSDKGDAFKVKVYRLRNSAEMPSLVLGLNNVPVSYIANPEQWLAKLVGGGPVFQMYVYHMSDATLPVAGTSRLIFNIGGPPKDCDHGQALDPRYDGPREIYFPEAQKAVGGSFNIPAPAGSLSSVPQSQVPGGNSPGLVSQVGGAIAGDPFARDRDQLAQERAALAVREREVTQRLHVMEMEAIRRENDAKIAALEMKFASRPVEHKTDLSGIVTALSSAMTPIITAILSGQQQTRIEMLKIQQEQAAQHQQLLSKLLDRSAVDPQVKEAQDRLFSVLEKQMTTEGPNVKMLTAVSEAMGSVMGLYGDAIKQLTDLQGGEKEPVGMLVVKELVKGINAVAGGVAASAKGKALPAPRALPPPPPAPRPVAVQPAPAPQPAGFAGAPTGNPQIVDELEAAIRARTIPSQVAATFVQALNDPYLNAALDEFGRDPLRLFQARLGKWAGEHPLNMQYVQQLAAELQRQLTASGVQFDDDAPEASDDSGDEGEDEEGEDDVEEASA